MYLLVDECLALCFAISLTRFLVALYVLCQTGRESRLWRRTLKCCRYWQMTGLGGITCLLDGDRGLIEMNEYLRSTCVFLACDYSDFAVSLLDEDIDRRVKEC
jgi:hypothetical protein